MDPGSFYGLQGLSVDGVPYDFTFELSGPHAPGLPPIEAPAAPAVTLDESRYDSAFEGQYWDPNRVSPATLEGWAQELNLDLPDPDYRGGIDLSPAPAPSFSADQIAALEQGLIQAEEMEVMYDSDLQRFTDSQGRPITPEKNPGLWKQLKDEVFEPLEKALGTNLGKSLWNIGMTLGLGGIGIAIAKLMSGDDDDEEFTMPASTPVTPAAAAGQNALTSALTSASSGRAPFSLTGGTGASSISPNLARLGPGATGAEDLSSMLRFGLAGQRNVADLALGASARELVTGNEQADLERLARFIALARLPGLLAGPEDDALTTQLSGRLTTALQGARPPNPLLDRLFKEEEERERNRLFRQLGRDYELSTPGIQSLAEMRKRQNELNVAEQERAILQYAPMVLARQQFSDTSRRADVNQLTGVSEGFGRARLPQLSTTLNSIVPTQPLLGLGDAEAERRIQDALRVELALDAFKSNRAGERAEAESIAKLFGTAAGSILPVRV